MEDYFYEHVSLEFIEILYAKMVEFLNSYFVIEHLEILLKKTLVLELQEFQTSFEIVNCEY